MAMRSGRVGRKWAMPLLTGFLILAGILVAPKYIGGLLGGPTSTLGCAAGLLFVYLLFNQRFLRAPPRPVLTLCGCYAVAAGSFASSGDARDLLFPLMNIGLILSAMVVLQRKRAPEDNLAPLAWLGMLLCAASIAVSIQRNDIQLASGVSSQRRGLNLLAFFAFVGMGYGLLLRTRVRWAVAGCFLAAIAYCGSRATMLAAVLALVVYVSLLLKRDQGKLRRAWAAAVVAGLGLWAVLMLASEAVWKSIHQSHAARIVMERSVNRLDSWAMWSDWALRNASLFLGDGYYTYSFGKAASAKVYPLNTYLDILNGSGAIAALLYVAFIVQYLRLGGRRSRTMDDAQAVGFAFGVGCIARAMFEIDHVGGTTMHVVSVCAAFLLGLPLVLERPVSLPGKTP
jgi:hypothetical protein